MTPIFQTTSARLIRYFVTGALAILPLVITVGVVVWVAGFLAQFLGPNTLVGSGLRRLGLTVIANETFAYAAGAVLVLVAIFFLGVALEMGARSLFQRLIDGLLTRLPLVGSIYGTSKQVVGMLDKKGDDQLKGMSVVFCHFGEAHGSGVLALLVSPQQYRIGQRDYLVVIVPTAPVPVGGGLLFVPVDMVQKTDLSVDALMSVYVSMGVTAPQYLLPVNPPAVLPGA